MLKTVTNAIWARGRWSLSDVWNILDQKGRLCLSSTKNKSYPLKIGRMAQQNRSGSGTPNELTQPKQVFSLSKNNHFNAIEKKVFSSYDHRLFHVFFCPLLTLDVYRCHSSRVCRWLPFRWPCLGALLSVDSGSHSSQRLPSSSGAGVASHPSPSLGRLKHIQIKGF